MKKLRWIKVSSLICPMSYVLSLKSNISSLTSHLSRLTTHLLFLIAFITLMSSCENDMSTVKKIASQKEAAVETGTDVEALYSDFGEVKARLTAPVMNHVDDAKNPYTELPVGLNLVFYADSLHVQSHLTAGYGISYDKSDEMIARNNVVVTNIYGEKLETEELVWNQKTEKISSDKFVKITMKDEIIFGDGFVSNEDISDYKIKKIRGTIKVNGAF